MTNKIIYHSDAARTVGVGEISEEARLLIERTRLSFFAGIKNAVAGNRLYDISGAIQQLAESFGYGVVYDLVGHGIGSHLHEDPELPKFIRSFPLIVAKIWCPFSSSTLKNAFGNFSNTTPSTSITSAFDILIPPVNKSLGFVMIIIRLAPEIRLLFHPLSEKVSPAFLLL